MPARPSKGTEISDNCITRTVTAKAGVISLNFTYASRYADNESIFILAVRAGGY